MGGPQEAPKRHDVREQQLYSELLCFCLWSDVRTVGERRNVSALLIIIQSLTHFGNCLENFKNPRDHHLVTSSGGSQASLGTQRFYSVIHAGLMRGCESRACPSCSEAHCSGGPFTGTAPVGGALRLCLEDDVTTDKELSLYCVVVFGDVLTHSSSWHTHCRPFWNIIQIWTFVCGRFQLSNSAGESLHFQL